MKKLLLSVLAIFLVIGLVGAGTFAWFQDTETSTGNTKEVIENQKGAI